MVAGIGLTSWVADTYNPAGQRKEWPTNQHSFRIRFVASRAKEAQRKIAPRRHRVFTSLLCSPIPLANFGKREQPLATDESVRACTAIHKIGGRKTHDDEPFAT